MARVDWIHEISPRIYCLAFRQIMYFIRSNTECKISWNLLKQQETVDQPYFQFGTMEMFAFEFLFFAAAPASRFPCITTISLSLNYNTVGPFRFSSWKLHKLRAMYEPRSTREKFFEYLWIKIVWRVTKGLCKAEESWHHRYFLNFAFSYFI